MKNPALPDDDPRNNPRVPDTETVEKILKQARSSDRKAWTGWLVAFGAVGGLAWKLIATQVDVSRVPERLDSEINTRQMHEQGFGERLSAIEQSTKDIHMEQVEQRQQLDRIEQQLKINRTPKDLP